MDLFNPPEADEVLTPRRLRRFIAVTDTPLLCGGAVHFSGKKFGVEFIGKISDKTCKYRLLKTKTRQYMDFGYSLCNNTDRRIQCLSQQVNISNAMPYEQFGGGVEKKI